VLISQDTDNTFVEVHLKIQPHPWASGSSTIDLARIRNIRWQKNAEKLDSPAVSALGVRSRKLSNALNGQSWDGWPKPYHLELLRASEGTLSRWSRLRLQSLAPTNPQWARVVGYRPFSLWVIHKKGLCPSSGDVNRLMMIKERWSRVVSGTK
jgi:hypothetical protein